MERWDLIKILFLEQPASMEMMDMMEKMNPPRRKQ